MTQIPDEIKQKIEKEAKAFVTKVYRTTNRDAASLSMETGFQKGAEWYASLHPSTEWVSVEDGLPELFEKVIVGWSNGDSDIAFLTQNQTQGKVFVDLVQRWAWVEQPTLWMPLPKPPTP